MRKSNISVEELPQPQQEMTPEEAEAAKGGLDPLLRGYLMCEMYYGIKGEPYTSDYLYEDAKTSMGL
jgi:hypothetical protein